MKRPILTLVLLLGLITSYAGSVEVISFSADNPDSFCFEATADIPGGTVLYFTDNEWIGTGFNNLNEQDESWTAPVAGIATGSIVCIEGSDATCGTATGTPAFAVDGDQLYISTAAIATSGMSAADICFGIDFSSGNNLAGIANSVDLPSVDNGVLTGTDATDPDDWDTDNNPANLTFPTGDCMTIVLPVSLTRFTGKSKNKMIELNWSTAQEINNDYFDIMYSRDGIRFNQVDKVEGNGTVAQQQEYKYEMENPPNGSHYFYLAQMDYDGTETRSEVISVTVVSARSFEISATLVSNNINLHLAEANRNYNVYILDATGRSVMQNSVSSHLGSVNLDISHLALGVYYVRLEGENNTLRFTKI
jgi:hypothetical protein